MLRGTFPGLVVLALASAALPARAQLAPAPDLPPETQVEITAERLVRQRGGEVRAEGGARVRAGDLRVAGEALVYDPATRTLRAEGRTTVQDGPWVLRAARMSLELDTGRGTFGEVELYQKKVLVPFEELVSAGDLSAAGVNALALTATTVIREEDGDLVADDPRVTLCDCGDGEEPSWRFAASSARLRPGESVALVLPRLELPRLPAPPLPLPYISLPLARRKTGLLVPGLSYTARRGAQVEQPVYLVLGRSYDATISPAYFTGPFGDRPPAFQGPRLGLELRYAPRVGTDGRVFVSWAYDLSKREITPEQRAAGEQVLTHRTAYQVQHGDDWGDHVADLLDVSLVSDRRYVSDFTDEVRLQGQQVTRSVGWVNARGGTVLASASAQYTQDLRRVPDLFTLDNDAARRIAAADSLRLFGSDDSRVTFQRLPVLQLDVVHFSAGPVAASVELEAAHLGPVGGRHFGDTGLDGLAVGDTGWKGPDAGEGNGVLDRPSIGARGGTTLRGTPGEQTSVTRLSLRPAITAPFLLPPLLAVRPYAGWRQNLYLYEALEDGAASWAIAGAEITSEIARRYPDLGLRHAILPRVEVRHLVPGPGTGGPPRPYDELDLGPRAAVTQAVVSVTSRLDPLRGFTSLQATVGQDLVLHPEPAPAESFVNGALQLGPLWTGAGLRWDAEDRFVSESSVRARLLSTRGDELRSSYLRVISGGSRRLRAGPDELFAMEDSIPRLNGISQLTAGATVVLSRWASVRYDILWLFTYPRELRILDQRRELVGALQQTAGFAYRSPCDCWGLGVSARYRRGQTGPPDIFFNLDLANL